MLRVDELAEKLDISRGTVVSLIKKGEIGAIKVGDQYRIPEENYQRFINSNVTISRIQPTYTGGVATPAEADNVIVDTSTLGAAVKK